MNHLESSFEGKNNLWRYLVMIVAVLLASNTIGGIPMFVAYGIKAAGNPEIISKLAANPSDIGALGFEKNIGLVLMLFPFVAGLIAFMLFIKPLNSRSFKQTINGTATIRWKRFFISAAVWTILSAVYLLVYMGIEPSNFTLNNKTITLLYLSIISILFIPFQASFEEVIFRGYLMQGFSVIIRNRWFPLVMTSVLFALMHSLNPEVKDFGFLTMMPQYFLFALVFGITTIMDDGIEVAMGAHTANNIFLCIFVTNSSSALQTASLYEQKILFPWTEFAGLLISAVLFLLILKVILKWTSFSLIFERVQKKEELIQPV
jgi:membrane protease YdiL (CAAX protease family)